VALAGSNEDNVVKTTSQEAFSLLPDVKAAMNKLCELKGIGPATASGTYAVLLGYVRRM
jgi:endonuclease III